MFQIYVIACILYVHISLIIFWNFSGLLSAHILASELQGGGQFLTWYEGELLDLAHDLGRRLLPAFNTSTGIPHSRVRFIPLMFHIMLLLVFSI